MNVLQAINIVCGIPNPYDHPASGLGTMTAHCSMNIKTAAKTIENDKRNPTKRKKRKHQIAVRVIYAAFRCIDGNFAITLTIINAVVAPTPGRINHA